MKQRRTIYNQNSITYWPNYTSVLGALHLFCFMGIGFAAMTVIVLFWHDSNNAVLTILSMVLSAISFYITYKIKCLKEKKVVIDISGITVLLKCTATPIFVSWSEVCEIKYERQPWYGLESLLIAYQQPDRATSIGTSQCNQLRLPLRSVDQDKLREIIPCTIPFA